MTVPLSATEMLAQIRDLAATLPTRCPTTLRVGPGVVAELKRLAAPAASFGAGQLPLGVRIVEDADYPIGQWRIFDQWDDELDAGVIPVPGATVPITLADGTSKDMRVIAVRDGQVYLADPASLDPTSHGTDMYFTRPNFRL